MSVWMRLLFWEIEDDQAESGEQCADHIGYTLCEYVYTHAQQSTMSSINFIF